MTSSFVRFTSSLALALGLVITPSFAEDTKAAVKKAAKAKATESAEAKAAKATEKPAAKVEAAAAKTEGVAAKSAAKGVAA